MHCKRNIIMPEDLKRGMMLEMFFFNKQDDSLERAIKIKEELVGDVLSESDKDVDQRNMEKEEFCESKCKCALCKCMNNIYTRWDEWSLEPKTHFESVFKEHIENMT
jgi:hypothetical protein